MSYSDSIPYHPLPNLVDLSPHSNRFRLQVAQYVAVACLTLCVWDWLLALADEFEMIRRSQRLVGHLLHGMYALIRISPVIYLAKESEFNSCRTFAPFIGGSNLWIIPGASGLFFARLTAVYSRNKYVMAFFGSCWLGIIGIFIYDTSTLFSRPATGNHSLLCFTIEPPDVWGYIATAIYDTLMYLAISWRLASFNRTNHWGARVRSFLTGGGLDRLSKILLHSGQAYYFVTIGFNICAVVFLYSPTVPPEWHLLLLDPNITITSIMACRLFRELKLGRFVDPTEVAFSTIVHEDMGDISQQQSGLQVVLELRTLRDDAGTDARRNCILDTGNVENSASV